MAIFRRTRATGLLVLVVLVVACGGRDAPPEVPLPELTAFDDALTLRLAGIATTASEVRGLELNEEIEQGSLSKEQVGDYYEQAATESKLQEEINYNALNTTYRLLHMIEPDDDLLELSGEESAADLLGFYSPDSAQLVLISDSPGELSLDNEATLAHEYVHSFQDQQFDLEKAFKRVEKEQREKANTEYGDAQRALIEGDATVAEFQYVEKKVGPEGLRQWLGSSDEEAGEDAEATKERDYPAAFGRYGAFPYTYGSTFVRHLYDDGGWEAVNAAYEDPPKTEEQILHPEKYLAGEGPVELKLRDLSKDLGKGWQQETDEMFGEFDVYNWVRSTLDSELQATSAAAGWGGGRLAVYSNTLDEKQVLVQMALIWDDRDEAREFYTTFGDVIKRIDPTPAILDPSLQIVGWEAEGEVGQAWIERTSFQMVVAVQQQDLDVAKRVVEAPASIPESGRILQARQPRAAASSPIHQLEDVLLKPGDLAPGFIPVQSSDQNTQNPIFSTNVEQRMVLFANVRSEDDGVMAMVIRERGVLPAGVSWALLETEDPRILYDAFVGGFALGGEVRSFSELPVDGIGEGSVAARAEVASADGPPQVIQMVVFGRGATLALVVTFQDAAAEPIDTIALARVMDERLSRYQP